MRRPAVAANRPLRPSNCTETVTSSDELERRPSENRWPSSAVSRPRGGEASAETDASAGELAVVRRGDRAGVRRGGSGWRLPDGGRGEPLKPEVDPLGPGDGWYYNRLIGIRRTT